MNNPEGMTILGTLDTKDRRQTKPTHTHTHHRKLKRWATRTPTKKPGGKPWCSWKVISSCLLLRHPLYSHIVKYGKNLVGDRWKKLYVKDLVGDRWKKLYVKILSVIDERNSMLKRKDPLPLETWIFRYGQSVREDNVTCL